MGFVSNSSSSSFVCNVCGRDESGMDIGLSDCEMHECKNGHTFCDEHLVSEDNGISLEAIVKTLKDDGEDTEGMDEEEIRDFYDENYGDDTRYDCSEKLCPTCQYKELDDAEALKYLMKDTGLSKEDLLYKMKGMFPDYSKLQEHLKNE